MHVKYTETRESEDKIEWIWTISTKIQLRDNYYMTRLKTRIDRRENMGAMGWKKKIMIL